MLFVSSLTVSHFRSHKVARLETDGRPVVFFGANGSGKTNLLEAVSLLSPGRGMRRASAEDMARKPESLGWKLQAVLHVNEATYEIETWSEQGAPRQVKIDGKPATQTQLGALCRVVWLVPVMDRLWVEGAEGRRRFLDRLALSFFPDHGEAAVTYEKAMRERNKLLKEQVRDGHWYKAVETHMAQSGLKVHSNRIKTIERLITAQSLAETSFPVADLELEQSEGAMPETVEDFLTELGDSRFRDLAIGRTTVGPHRTDMVATYRDKGVQAKAASTGEQKALLVSLILANGRALCEDIGYAPLLLLDEVSAHLDVARRAALYDEICALNAQAWMTGTEAEMFREFAGRADQFEIADDSTGSSISRVTY